MRTALARVALVLFLAAVGFGASELARVDRTAHAATLSNAGIMYEVGLGGQTITNPVAATFLTVPQGAEHAWITVKNNPACWGMDMDGTAPTATSGGEWPVTMFKYDNDGQSLKLIRVINCAEGATTVKVYYTKRRR